LKEKKITKAEFDKLSSDKVVDLVEGDLSEKHKQNSQINFQKTQAKLVSKLYEGEIIPEFREKNTRPFLE
jgi:hypothetical protein